MLDPKIIPTHAIINDISSIDSFKVEWEALRVMRPQKLESLKSLATVQSTGSSTRIEGAKLNDEEVAQLLGRMGPQAFHSRDEEEVVGYGEALKTILGSHAEIPLTENHIKQIHLMTLRHSTKDERHRGDYKKHPNHVQASDADGNILGIIFETATPFETPEKMRELVEWTRLSLEAKSLHPLLVIAVFIIRYLAIHPFQDGNGRSSRLLTCLLLLREGYAFAPYASLERIIEDNKAEYYAVLRTTQKTFDTPQEDHGPWINFFLKMLLAQQGLLRKKVGELKKMESLHPLQSAVIDRLLAQGSASISELFHLTEAKRATLKWHLKELKEAGRITVSGRGRSVRYRLPEAEPAKDK